MEKASDQENPTRSEQSRSTRRRIAPITGWNAVRAWQRGLTDRPTVATAVRFTLEELTTRAPGNSVEVRVPPFGVVQCMDGPRHTRGTPPNTIETTTETWLAVATGAMSWAEATTSGALRASGTRADLSDYLPLIDAIAPEHDQDEPER
ncbi:MAG: sterol carrier family protein [Actinomycetota bacterium]